MKRRLLICTSALFLWICGVSFGSILQIYGIGLFIICIVIPVAWMNSSSLRSHLLFLPYFNYGPFLILPADCKNPKSHGLRGVRNRYVETTDHCQVGAWHILPRDLVDSVADTEEEYEKAFASDHDIVVYLHGNSGSRAIAHRVELYQLLQDMNYHVVCFDYRGYADSSPVLPDEVGVCRDARAIYEWVHRRKGKNNKVFVWGHSLGTAVACHVVGELCRDGTHEPPCGVILEAPFNNLEDAVRMYPMSWLFKKLPYFKRTFIEPLKAGGLEFSSDTWLSHIHVPIMILHAHDDFILPFFLGHKLFLHGKRTRSANAKPISLLAFRRSHGLGHKFICRFPALKDHIGPFFRHAAADNWNSAPGVELEL